MSMLGIIVIGLVIGLIVATIGAWKDTRWEPFRWRTFWRTPIIAGVCACMLALHRLPWWLLIGFAAIAVERVCVELWKGIVRHPPSKFRQPERDTGWLVERFRSAFGTHRLAPLIALVMVFAPPLLSYFDFWFARHRYGPQALSGMVTEAVLLDPFGGLVTIAVTGYCLLHGNRKVALAYGYLTYGIISYLGAALKFLPTLTKTS